MTLGLTAWAFQWDEEDEEYQVVWEGGPLGYGIHQSEDGLCLCFVPVSFWKREGCIPDNHCKHILKSITTIPAKYLADEACENQFVIDEHTPIAEIEADMASAGLVKIDDLMQIACANTTANAKNKMHTGSSNVQLPPEAIEELTSYLRILDGHTLEPEQIEVLGQSSGWNNIPAYLVHYWSHRNPIDITVYLVPNGHRSYYAWEAGPVYYQFSNCDGTDYVHFVSKARYDRCNDVDDQEISSALELVTTIDRRILEDECTENHFDITGRFTREDARLLLNFAGCIEHDFGFGDDDEELEEEDEDDEMSHLRLGKGWGPKGEPTSLDDYNARYSNSTDKYDALSPEWRIEPGPELAELVYEFGKLVVYHPESQEFADEHQSLPLLASNVIISSGGWLDDHFGEYWQEGDMSHDFVEFEAKSEAERKIFAHLVPYLCPFMIDDKPVIGGYGSVEGPDGEIVQFFIIYHDGQGLRPFFPQSGREPASGVSGVKIDMTAALEECREHFKGSVQPQAPVQQSEYKPMTHGRPSLLSIVREMTPNQNGGYTMVSQAIEPTDNWINPDPVTKPLIDQVSAVAKLALMRENALKPNMTVPEMFEQATNATNGLITKTLFADFNSFNYYRTGAKNPQIKLSGGQNGLEKFTGPIVHNGIPLIGCSVVHSEDGPGDKIGGYFYGILYFDENKNVRFFTSMNGERLNYDAVLRDFIAFRK